MKKLKLHLIFCSVFFSLYCTFIGSASDDMKDESNLAYEIGLRGRALYEEGDYKEAAGLLLQALEAGEISFALTYADICYRDLDKAKHMPKEAAYWYINAAEANDGDALAYLNSISPNLLEVRSIEDKVQQLVHLWAKKDANKGFELYVEEKFKEASKFLKRASIANHPLAQQLYGDICLRQLDGKPHTLLEAARWYLLSAYGGDPHSFSYLVTLIPDLLQTNKHADQMRAIVGCWVIDEAITDLKRITPGTVNNYIIFEHKRKIDKTTAQKLPYLFDRIASAILFNLAGRAHCVIDDQLFPKADTVGPSFTSNKCGLSVTNFLEMGLMRHNLAAFCYGPVYVHYFKSLDKKLDSNGFLKIPSKKKDISPLYGLLLDALHESTKEYRATDLSAISHQDYPWLWAGIMFWKEKYQKPFNFTSYSEADLLKILTDFSTQISEKNILVILSKIESRDIWPNDSKHPLCEEFSQRMRKYFVSESSRKNPLVEAIEKLFYAKLKTQVLDCSTEKGRLILQNPFLMFYCRNLTLNNVLSTAECYKAFLKGQRYFVELKLILNFSSTFNQEHKHGKNLLMLIQTLNKKGLEITQN